MVIKSKKWMLSSTDTRSCGSNDDSNSLLPKGIRGTTTILAGVFTLSGEKIVAGLKDYLSLLIQAVALPVIGIVATFHPKTGLGLLGKLTKHHKAYGEQVSSSRYVRIVESFFRGIGGIPSSFIFHSTKSVSFLLHGKVLDAGLGVVEAFVKSFKSLGGIFAGGWSADYYEATHIACNIKKIDLLS